MRDALKVPRLMRDANIFNMRRAIRFRGDGDGLLCRREVFSSALAAGSCRGQLSSRFSAIRRQPRLACAFEAQPRRFADRA